MAFDNFDHGILLRKRRAVAGCDNCQTGVESGRGGGALILFHSAGPF